MAEIAIQRARFAERRWRWIRHALAAAVLGAGIFGAVARRHELLGAGRQLDELRWGWVLVAVALEAGSLVLFARLQRTLLRWGGVGVGMSPMVQLSLAANAMSVTLPGGAALSAAWSWEQLRRRGANRVLAGWVVLVAGALSSFALFVILATGTQTNPLTVATPVDTLCAIGNALNALTPPPGASPGPNLSLQALAG